MSGKLRGRAKSLAVVMASVATLTLMASCGTGDGGGTLFSSAPPPGPCPALRLLAGADRITEFAEGSGRDIIDVVLEGEITAITGACEYDMNDDDGTGTLLMALAVEMTVARGPAERQRQVSPAYFIAVANTDKAILNKQVYPVTIKFPDTATQATYRDEAVDITLPLAPGQTGRDFEVYVGFQLSRDQILYNRQTR